MAIFTKETSEMKCNGSSLRSSLEEYLAQNSARGRWLEACLEYNQAASLSGNPMVATNRPHQPRWIYLLWACGPNRYAYELGLLPGTQA